MQRFRPRSGALYALGACTLTLGLTGCQSFFDSGFWNCALGSTDACQSYGYVAEVTNLPRALELTAVPGNGAVRLTWTRVDGIGTYTVSRTSAHSVPVRWQIPSLGQGACLFDRDVQNYEVYTYRVAWDGDAGNAHVSSNAATATPADAEPTLTPPPGCWDQSPRSLSGRATATLSARLSGKLTRRGKIVRRGGGVVGTGYVLSGTVRGTIVQSGRTRRFSGGKWRARLQFSIDPRRRVAATAATVLVTGGLPGKLCLVYVSSTLPVVRGKLKHDLQGTFVVLGATGRAARVVPRGSFLAHQTGAASWTLGGRGTVAAGKAKRLPKQCTALAK